MKNPIMVNDKMLSEYIKEKEELELEQEVKEYNSEIRENYFNYQKPRLRIASKKERNGRVIMAKQQEINLRNREELVKRALIKGDLRKAMVYWYIGCYKQEKIITMEVANEFERIMSENHIKLRFKNIFAAIRNYFGQIKKTVFGEEYIIHKRPVDGPNYYFLSEEGYNLTPERAVNLMNMVNNKYFSQNENNSNMKRKDFTDDIVVKNNGVIADTFSSTYKDSNIKENQVSKKEEKDICINDSLKDRFGINIEDLTKNGLTVNIFGNIIINR